MMSPGASLYFVRAGTVCVDHFYALRAGAGSVAEQLADCGASRAGHGVPLGRPWRAVWADAGALQRV